MYRSGKTAATTQVNREPAFVDAPDNNGNSDSEDYPAAAAISFVLMAIILVGVLLYTRALGTEDLV